MAILKELNGYFVLTDDNGEEFIVAHRDQVGLAKSASETQLRLEPTPSPKTETTESFLEDMNRAIAMTRESELDASFDDLGAAVGAEYEPEHEPSPEGLPPPRRVRFEPIRGDLPPELQE